MIKAIRTSLGRVSDLALALAVVMTVALLIVEVPTWLMDVLLVTNLGISAVVLLVALYAPDARRLPSFPTILLLTTLLRLALNVSSTRLILLHADAGRVIYSFGHVVVGGNYVVGGVVFLVLVIVQFVVIAKGSERVAEVAARFTLDAMPGKQMSIDADLRGQLIDNKQAQEKRAELERESRLYGAMDGAMKFVKGDAIAGVVISTINIIGGLLIGMYYPKALGGQQLSLEDAAQTYSLLTVGDGLVAQIPSILTCIAAGLVVTRVASTEDAPVSGDIADQFLGQPRALAIVAVLLLGIGLAPGFPRVPFLLLGGAAAVLAWVGARRVAARGAGGSTKIEAAATDKTGGGSAIDPARLVMMLGSEAAEALGETFGEDAARAAAGVAADLGVALPVLVAERGGAANGYAVEMFGAPGGVGVVPANAVLAFTDADRAGAAGLALVSAALPQLKRPCIWVSAAQAGAANQGGIATMSVRDAVLWHLDLTLRRNAYRYVGIAEVHRLFESLRSTEEGAQLVKAVSPMPLGLQAVAEVMQRLVREGVPIRHTRLILESLAKWGQTVKAPQYLAERVRRDLAPIICARWASAPGRLSVYPVASEVEDLVRNNVEDTSEGQIVGMAIDERRSLVNAVRRVINPDLHTVHDPVLMVENASIRRALRSILERQLPEVAVLSYDELGRDVMVETLGEVQAAAAT